MTGAGMIRVLLDHRSVDTISSVPGLGLPSAVQKSQGRRSMSFGEQHAGVRVVGIRSPHGAHGVRIGFIERRARQHGGHIPLGQGRRCRPARRGWRQQGGFRAFHRFDGPAPSSLDIAALMFGPRANPTPQ